MEGESPSSFPSRRTGIRAAGSQRLQPPLLVYILQASPQKIDLQRLASNLSLQLGNAVLLDAISAVAQKRLGPMLPQLSLAAMQDVCVYFTGARTLSRMSSQFAPASALP